MSPACAVAGCGRPIVKGKHLPWVHATNPGRAHHHEAKPNEVARQLEKEKRNG